MSEWKKVTTNSNLIQHETERAVLIKLPKSEFKFWHPSKCCRTSGKSGYRLSISYTDEFTFRVFRNGKGQWNKGTVLEKKELTVKQFESCFNVGQN